MKSFIAFIILLTMSIGIGMIDSIANPLKKDPIVFEKTSITSILDTSIFNPYSFTLTPPAEAKLLFSQYQIEHYIPPAIITTVLEENLPIGSIYELDASTYFEIRHALNSSSHINKENSIFDSNNLGEYSLYYNDTNRKDRVFRIVHATNRVIALEYDRKYHETFVEITKTLVEKSRML